MRIGSGSLAVAGAASAARVGAAAAAAIGAGGLGVFAVQVARVADYTVDDAYIVFRYAENLAAGRGATFHLDGTAVEGVTQVLWMLWMVVPHLLGLDAVAFAKIVGVAAMLATIAWIGALTARFANGIGWPKHEAALAGACAAAAFAALPFTAVHAVAGLGTAWFCLVLLALFDAAVRFRRAPSRPRAAILGLLGLAAGLSRPEGNAFAALLAVGLTVSVDVRARRALLGGLLLFHVVPGAAWFLLRYAYYGLPMPLPYYVKMQGGADFGAAIATGAELAARLIEYLGPVWLVPLLAAVLAIRGCGAWPVRAAAAVGVAFFALQTLPLQLMGYGFRYFFPALVILAIPVGLGAVRVARVLGSERWRAVVGVVLAAGLVFGGMRATGAYAEMWGHYAAGMRRAHTALGVRLAGFVGGSVRPTVAVADAGAIPYLSGWEALDTFGLNDPVIARHPERRVARFLAVRPDLLVVLSKAADRFDPVFAWERDLVAAARSAGYDLAEVVSFSDTYHLRLLARPDGSVAAFLRADAGSRPR